MAKDVNKAQKKNVIKEDNKKISKKEKRAKVVIEEVTDTKKTEVKENVKTSKVNKEKMETVVRMLDDSRKAILFGVVGFLLATLLFRCILWPDRIATLKDGTQPVVNINGETITANDLYDSMKKQYSVKLLLNEVDNMVLTEKYPETDEMKSEVSDTAEYYFSVYEQSYGYTKEEFLSAYGFASEKDFVESLKLDYRRNKYYEEYAAGLITDKEIEKYYDKNVFGDVDSKHILVKVDKNNKDGLSDEDAKKLAKEIISKLNSGKTWDEVIEEYKDKIVHEELGYNAFNASLEKNYLEECKKLEVGKYSKNPVSTSYGYHIVYKINQKDTPTLEEVRDDVIDILAQEKMDADKNLYYKSLIAMRTDAEIEFIDTKLGDEYKEYVNSYK